MKDATQRFSNRVDDYIKYRPKYPVEIIAILKQYIGLNANSIITDIGAGTGFLTELFLNNGNKTFAIEPNEAMRLGCKTLYGNSPYLFTIDGNAENTTLPNHSVDMIVAAQAFHWFDQQKAKAEFSRILKTGGNIVLVWNARKDELDFSREYDNILSRHIAEYTTLDHRNVSDKNIETFFAPAKMSKAILSNEQVFNWESFRGRTLSSSYVPKEGRVYEIIMDELKQLFDVHQQNGQVKFEYDTLVYWSF